MPHLQLVGMDNQKEERKIIYTDEYGRPHYYEPDYVHLGSDGHPCREDGKSLTYLQLKALNPLD